MPDDIVYLIYKQNCAIEPFESYVNYYYSNISKRDKNQLPHILIAPFSSSYMIKAVESISYDNEKYNKNGLNIPMFMFSSKYDYILNKGYKFVYSVYIIYILV